MDTLYGLLTCRTDDVDGKTILGTPFFNEVCFRWNEIPSGNAKGTHYCIISRTVDLCFLFGGGYSPDTAFCPFQRRSFDVADRSMVFAYAVFHQIFDQIR